MKPGAHVQVKKIFIGGVREDVDNEELKGNRCIRAIVMSSCMS